MLRLLIHKYLPYWTTLEISAPRCALMCYPSSNITYCIACLLCIGVILLNQFKSIHLVFITGADRLSTDRLTPSQIRQN